MGKGSLFPFFACTLRFPLLLYCNYLLFMSLPVPYGRYLPMTSFMPFSLHLLFHGTFKRTSASLTEILKSSHHGPACLATMKMIAHRLGAVDFLHSGKPGLTLNTPVHAFFAKVVAVGPDRLCCQLIYSLFHGACKTCK